MKKTKNKKLFKQAISAGVRTVAELAHFIRKHHFMTTGGRG